MKKMKYGIILFMNSVMFCIVSSERIVMTRSGPVRGTTIPFPNSEVEAFLGIPYAEPPVGKLRFRKPIPIKPWDDVYNATRKPSPCCQNATEKMYWMPNTENMTEDCLYLNIWVPIKNSYNELKTVIVWIHGGAFNLGSSNMNIYDGAILSNYGDVITASLNYRVGVFGFLSAFVEDAAGNMGLYDQVLALKWLRKNIIYFGGDPDEIVLMGESAGAMSIGAHLISPMTKHLFKRAIMESGAAVHPMVVDNSHRLLKTGNTLAKMVDCADKEVNLSTNPQIVVDCLKRLSVLDLTRAEGLLMKTNPITFYPRWGDEYMPVNPLPLLHNAKFKNTEVLLGINKDEGSLFLTAILPEYFGIYGHNGIEKVNKRLAHSFIQGIFKFTEQVNGSKIADFYVKNVPNYTTPFFRKALYDSLGDYLITCSAVFFADFFSLKRAPVYFYKFSHRPSTAIMAEWAGTTHFDEVQYVFKNPLQPNLNFTTKEEMLSERIMNRWLAFAKTGDPNIPDTIQWPQYTLDYPVYLDIDIEETIRLHPDNRRCEFWRDRFDARINRSQYPHLFSFGSTVHAQKYYVFLIVETILVLVFLRFGGH